MKPFFLVGILIMSSTILCSDRFDADERKAEEAFSDFSDKLVGIKEELKILNDRQWLIIALLGRICDTVDQYSEETWENHPAIEIPKG